MACKEQQDEELEVLHSIYDGDEFFKEIGPTSFQYKYGEDGNYKSFMLEISWPETYPDEPPVLNLDLFYNKHILSDVKEFIKQQVLEQVEESLGMPMTFSLFEWVKDNLENLTANQPDAPLAQNNTRSDLQQSNECISVDSSKKKEKKEQMTKAQKRRVMDKYGATSEKTRGWNWVDIVKHLSQTGGKNSDDS
ncbi:RWD domain-containing protein 4-like [Gigantopelta aegis]|uniref:RWD domain-containing protein 4-like n=1 Tax=Gigantopelta aegis TaxID=1735272 RepID=UPI001B88998E|nr:RWD domain-containing protein 4-like [Gigantopelta aegis]XP_041378976.1 RWD domain-containing protein 4-like [Gigantopelta aegis]